MDNPTTYEIKVEGSIDEKWSEWFNGLTVASDSAGDGPPVTTLTGTVIDQAKLRGIMSKLWDMNLRLISIIRIKLEKDEPHSYDGGESNGETSENGVA